MPWQRIVSGTENLAKSHETLAQRIEADVEIPLRQFSAKNREMQNLGTVQGNLASIAKELGNAQKKAASGGRKADAASSKAEDAGREWETQAPFVFEQLQALDESRVNHLRDVLTQFQTHEVDQVERNRVSAESCLNALLNIETADEIKTFATRISGQRGSLTQRPGSAATRPSSSSLQPPPTPPPPRLADDRYSQRSNSEYGQDRVAPRMYDRRTCCTVLTSTQCLAQHQTKASLVASNVWEQCSIEERVLLHLYHRLLRRRRIEDRLLLSEEGTQREAFKTWKREAPIYLP